MDFPDVLPPFQTAIPPAGTTIDGTNYTWVLGNGNYHVRLTRRSNFKTGDKHSAWRAGRSFM